MPFQVVVFAKSGRLRDSLQALLNSSQKITVSGMVDCPTNLFDMIEDSHPAMLILDTNLTFERVLETLRDVRRSYAHLPCLVLADTGEQRSLVLEAGARQALIKGFSLVELWSAINQALDD